MWNRPQTLKEYIIYEVNDAVRDITLALELLLIDALVHVTLPKMEGLIS